MTIVDLLYPNFMHMPWKLSSAYARILGLNVIGSVSFWLWTIAIICVFAFFILKHKHPSQFAHSGLVISTVIFAVAGSGFLLSYFFIDRNVGKLANEQAIQKQVITVKNSKKYQTVTDAILKQNYTDTSTLTLNGHSYKFEPENVSWQKNISPKAKSQTELRATVYTFKPGFAGLDKFVSKPANTLHVIISEKL